MSAEQIVTTFQELFQNPDKLKNGKEILEHFLAEVPQFASTTCRVITSQEVDSEFRKLVGYIMKNILSDNWMENKALIKERKVRFILMLWSYRTLKKFS